MSEHSSAKVQSYEKERQEIISSTAYKRILALHDQVMRDQVMQAAAMIGNPNCYTDFHCEGELGQPSFNETFAPPDTPPSLEREELTKKLRQRMGRLDRIKLQRDQAFTAENLRAMGRAQGEGWTVVQAYLRMRERTQAKDR